MFSTISYLLSSDEIARKLPPDAGAVVLDSPISRTTETSVSFYKLPNLWYSATVAENKGKIVLDALKRWFAFKALNLLCSKARQRSDTSRPRTMN